MLSKKIALRYRSVLRLKGPDSLNLLQGLVTPNILKKTSAYGYALDVRGRILFDFFFHSLQGSSRGDDDNSNSYALDLDSDSTTELALKHFKQHRLRKKVELNVDHSLGVFVSSKPEELLIQDPRTENTNIHLFRGLLNHLDNDSREEDAEIYNEMRLQHGWAEGRNEIPPGMCFPLEYNGDILPGEAISFNKGCYVGQELTARTHHTGVIRKRIMPLLFDKQCSDGVALDSPLKNINGKSVGKLRSEISPSGRALGLVRIKDVLESPKFECNGLVCRAEIPSWWPELY